METQATPRQCAANVYRSDGVFGGSPCMNMGKVENNGKWWCSVHTQAATKKREAKSQERYRTQSAEWNAKYARQEENRRRAKHFDALVVALELYMDGDKCVCDNEGDGCVYDVAHAALEVATKEE